MAFGANTLPHIPYVATPLDLGSFDMVMNCESCGGQTLYRGRVAKCAYCGRCAKTKLPVRIEPQILAVAEYERTR